MVATRRPRAASGHGLRLDDPSVDAARGSPSNGNVAGASWSCFYFAHWCLSLTHVRRALCLGTIAVGLVALFGWIGHVDAFRTVLPGLTTMKANTVVGLVLAGFGLLLELATPGRRSAVIVMGVVVAALGVITLDEYAFGAWFGLDELLFRDLATTSMPYPGRMSPATALAFLPVGVAMVLLTSRHARSVIVAHVLAVVPAVVGYLSLAGYAYGVESLYSFGPFVSVAIHTTVALAAIALAMLMTRANEGWARGYRQRPLSRAVLLRLLVLSLTVPFVSGLLVVLGARLGFYEPLFGPALFASISALAIVWLALRAAASVRRAEGEMLTAVNALARLNADLERQVAERTREEKLTWQVSPDLLCSLNPDGSFENANPARQTALGWSPEELRGTSHTDLVHPDDLPGSSEAFATAMRGEPALRLENRYRARDGAYRWLSWVAMPEGGKVCCSARDVTSERDAEASRVVLEEQLRQAQKMEAVGQLTGGVAHDINNLLTVIRSSTDLLKRPNLREDRRVRYVEAISDTVDRAAKLTGQLLAFARRQSLTPSVFDAGSSVRAIGEMMGTLTGSRIAVTTQLPDEACFLNADSSQFDTALVNMVVNARDAMAGEGQLTIRVRAVGEMPATRAHQPIAGAFVAVSITDTGCGIAADDRDRIFEPFFTTKGVGQRTGLGLSQVFGFAKQSDGEVLVESELGRGTTFTLYLPRVPEAAGATEDDEQEPLVDGHGTRVLIVEDNAAIGSFTSQALAELGYRTTWAIGAEAALAELTKDIGCFDVVFSDMVIPGMNGIDLAKEIRRRHRDLPVVLTSGYSHVLAQNGTYGFELLRKPYSIEQMSRVLRKAATWQRRQRLMIVEQ